MERKNKMQWSHYSERIFEEFTSTDNSIIVQACPGAGKTTNVKHIWTLDDKPTLYVVFNKHNQREAVSKLPKKDGSDILTLNALGHRIIGDNYGRVTLDDRKVYGIIKDQRYKLYGRDRNWYDKALALSKIVSMAKLQVNALTLDQVDLLCDTYDLDMYDGIYNHIHHVLDISDRMRKVIDFNDQIRFPAVFNLHMPHYYNVLGDEAQDFNPIQATMLAKLKAERYVLVGDRHQSIYGFRGAMTNSMDFLKEAFNCVELPLSITYRCSKEIVKEAYAIFPDIESWDEKGDGIVRKSKRDDEMYGKNDIVLCRINKPLIDMAYSLLSRNIACHVRGRDIGQGLIRLVKKMEATSVRHLITALTDWRDVEVQKAIAKERDMKVESVKDKYNSLMIFIDKCSLEDDCDIVVRNIEALFEQGKGVCLSTVHKAKGLEADRCFIEQSNLMPFPMAKKKWQREQENNIKYVAVTRAIDELVYM